MTPFPLKIVTPDGSKFEGMAEEVIVRTSTGDLGVLAGHINCVAPLGMGRATVIIDGQKRYGACIGGLLTVLDGAVNLLPTAFEWAQDIDVPRAQRSEERAQAILNDKTTPETDIKVAQARLRRALVRKSVAQYK